MTQTNSHYYNQIRRIKDLGSTVMKIKIDGDSVILQPIDESEETIRLMTKWRNKYGDFFQTKFKATEDGTRKYIRNRLIGTPDRILFIIILKNQKVGHIGIYHYDKINNTVEVDNVLRAVRNDYPKLMEKIVRNLIKWLFDDLKLSKIVLRTFCDNYKAINLYERCNLLTVKSIPC